MEAEAALEGVVAQEEIMEVVTMVEATTEEVTAEVETMEAVVMVISHIYL